jgi:hypothetical protein
LPGCAGTVSDEAGFASFEQAGCTSIALGKEVSAGTEAEGKWHGHLVVVVPRIKGDRHAIIDLTIVQVSKPEWGMPMQPLRLGVGDDFVTGNRLSVFERPAYTMVYQAGPNDRSYREDGNLFAIEGLDLAVDNIVRNMRMLRVI